MNIEQGVNASVGRNICKARHRQKLTQTDLANKIGKSLVTVNNYENGKMSPTVQTVYKIAEALECSAHDLI